VAAKLAGVVCPDCGAAEFRTFWQTFANGTRHVRLDCTTCGQFVRYAKQHRDAPEPKHEAVVLDTPAYCRAALVPEADRGPPDAHVRAGPELPAKNFSQLERR
jgi:hypothetical protein